MSNFQKIILGVFLLATGAIVYYEATRPMPLSWFASYDKEDKIPLGTYIIHDLLKQHFKDSFTDVNTRPYTQLINKEMSGTYMFVNNHITFDQAELEHLLNWTAKGNTLFLAANRYGKNLLDTLNLEINTFFFYDRLDTQPLLNLVNKELKAPTPYHIQRNLNISFFKKIDTLSHTVLGVSQAFEGDITINKPEANFLKVPFENGNIFLYTQPEIFTNFFLLDPKNNPLTSKVLSYINDGSTIYWDNYYKTGKRIDISPLHILFKTKSLKWAYYLLLTGVVSFIFFEGKRKQRSIPVIKPLTNKTFEYTQTISGIYKENKDNLSIAKKIITQFLEYIRIKLRIQTNQINKRFFEETALRSNNNVEDIVAIFEEIKKIEQAAYISNEELESLHKKISQFKTNTDGKP